MYKKLLFINFINIVFLSVVSCKRDSVSLSKKTEENLQKEQKEKISSNKLEIEISKVKFDYLDFKDASIRTILLVLAKRARENHPDPANVKFIFNVRAIDINSKHRIDLIIENPLPNLNVREPLIPFAEVIDKLCVVAKLKWAVHDDKIVITPLPDSPYKK